MEKNNIVILEDRGLISIKGPDSKDFLQNVLTNDVEKSEKFSTIHSAILTPQGKYLYEFFLIKTEDGYLLDCADELTKEIILHLSKYKLRSNIEIINLSSAYAVGIIDLEKFKEIQTTEKTSNSTIIYRDSIIFIDSRTSKLGARIISNLEKLYLTIKKLNLKIVENSNYLNKAHLNGVPIKGTKNLKNQLFGLEANFEKLNTVDFQKGCYVGQENTARMKLKNKLRRRLFPIKSNEELKVGDQLIFENKSIGKVMIKGSYPFALIKLFDPEFIEFKDKEIFINGKKIIIVDIL